MYQRKAVETENSNGHATANGATIGYGDTSGIESPGNFTTPIPSKKTRRVRKRRKRRGRLAVFQSRMKSLILPAIVLFGLLWIRVLWKIGVYRMSPDIKLFQLESEEAPQCEQPKNHYGIDTTLVTQFSDDRIWMMGEHCRRYGPHPISVAVYTNNTLKEIIIGLKSWGCDIENEINNDDVAAENDGEEEEEQEYDDLVPMVPETDTFRQVIREDRGHAKVTVQILNATTHGAWNDYPVNELRNLALKGVKTTHVTYIDVDFWPGWGLYETLMYPSIKKKLFDDPKLALVIPAFQLKRDSNCTDETMECDQHIEKVPKTIADLHHALKAQRVDVFDKYNSGGHSSTDYQYWIENQMRPQLGGKALHEIPCLKSHRYEPFVTIRYCKETPPFQTAFSGYGKNKMTWMMQVVASGYVFSQVSGAFLVHYPHAISDSRQEWNNAPKELQQGSKDGNYNVRKPKKSDGNLGFENFHRGKVDDLYVRFKQWLKDTIPNRKARMTMCENFQDDDNKLWIDPDRKDWKTTE